MKKILILAAVLIGNGNTIFAACPNLTGDYTFTSPETGYTEQLSITQSEQNGLTTYVINFENMITTAITDGVVRTTEEKGTDTFRVSTDAFVCANDSLVQTFTEKNGSIADGSLYSDHQGQITMSLQAGSNLSMLMNVRDNIAGEDYPAETIVYTRK